MRRSMVDLLRISDLLSILNLSFGFISIAFSLSGKYWLSLSFILLSILGDGLDGLVARSLGEGELGERIDSLADMVSFSIAPSALAYSLYRSIYIMPFLILYLGCSAVRLSAYHLFKKEDSFVGLPVSACCLMISSACMFSMDVFLMDIMLIVLSLDMVSKIPYPKVDGFIGSVALILILSVLIVREGFDLIFVKILFFSSMIYVMLGPFYARYLAPRTKIF